MYCQCYQSSFLVAICKKHTTLDFPFTVAASPISATLLMYTSLTWSRIDRGEPLILKMTPSIVPV